MWEFKAMIVRAWLCDNLRIHHWTPNRVGGTRRWCSWGGHWEGKQ